MIVSACNSLMYDNLLSVLGSYGVLCLVGMMVSPKFRFMCWLFCCVCSARVSHTLHHHGWMTTLIGRIQVAAAVDSSGPIILSVVPQVTADEQVFSNQLMHLKGA